MADRLDYAAGARARIQVASPFAEALALITVEREQVLAAFTQPVRGPDPVIELPLDDAWRPMAGVGITLLAHEGARREGFFATGSTVVRIGLEREGLEIATRLAARRLQLALSVTDVHGRPATAELVVSVIEESAAGTLDGRDGLAREQGVRAALQPQCAPAHARGRRGLRSLRHALLVPEGGEPVLSATDSRLLFERLTTDQAGRASVRLPAPLAEHRYTLLVLAASESGAVGATRRTLVGRP